MSRHLVFCFGDETSGDSRPQNQSRNLLALYHLGVFGCVDSDWWSVLSKLITDTAPNSNEAIYYNCTGRNFFKLSRISGKIRTCIKSRLPFETVNKLSTIGYFSATSWLLIFLPKVNNNHIISPERLEQISENFPAEISQLTTLAIPPAFMPTYSNSFSTIHLNWTKICRIPLITSQY